MISAQVLPCQRAARELLCSQRAVAPLAITTKLAEPLDAPRARLRHRRRKSKAQQRSLLEPQDQFMAGGYPVPSALLGASTPGQEVGWCRLRSHLGTELHQVRPGLSGCSVTHPTMSTFGSPRSPDACRETLHASHPRDSSSQVAAGPRVPSGHRYARGQPRRNRQAGSTLTRAGRAGCNSRLGLKVSG